METHPQKEMAKLVKPEFNNIVNKLTELFVWDEDTQDGVTEP